MVYIRYIEGRGPYAYISRRKGDEVESVYLGPVSVELANLLGGKSYTREKHRKEDEVISDLRSMKKRVEERGGSLRLQTLIPETIERTNERVVERFGGDKGVLDSSAIGYISSVVKSTKGLYKKSARLLMHIVERHPFLDGNKRTAFQCASDFLEYHGKEIDAEAEEIQKFMNTVARGNSSFQEVVKWLKEKTN